MPRREPVISGETPRLTVARMERPEIREVLDFVHKIALNPGYEGV